MRPLRTAVLLVCLVVVPAASAYGPSSEPGIPVAGGKARVVVVGRQIRGTGFEASERVRVSVLQSGAKRVARQMTTSAKGTFTMRMSTTLNRCLPAVVVAIGDDGSHATYRVPRLLC